MPTLKQIIFASTFIFALLSTAIAQESAAAQKSSLTITAAAAGERVRIAAPSSIVQMHVEVYAASGEKLFDQEIRGGNVFDWHLQDGQAQRLAPGSYVCVVTAKSISGKLTQKIGTVSVEEKSVSVQPAESPQLSVLQAQTIGPVEENSSWTIPGKDEPQTPTVIANDGTDGQMIRGRGALTFRIGNFFTGIDTEQMRLTEDGNLGIGTSEPKSKLDVAGAIRAERFLVVKPNKSGGDQTTADSSDSVQPLSSGSGTQGRIAKWLDNAGTLGDTSVSESNGAVVIGTAQQSGNLQIFGPATADVFAGMGPDLINGPAFNYGYAGGSFGRSAGFFNVRPDPSAIAPNPSLRFATANVQRMIVDNNGNVGIGTTNPSAPLDVAGNINTSTQYNIGGNRVLSIPGANNLFAGQAAGQSNLPNSGRNSFFGSFAGQQNMSGDNNSFFGAFAGQQNMSGSDNSFFGFAVDGAPGITNATAIGYRAEVMQSNSLVLGGISGINEATADTNVGIGTTAPSAKLHVNGAGSDGAGQTDLRITGTGQIASGITLESTGTGGRTYSWLSTADNTGGGGSGPGRLAVFDVTAGSYRMVIDGTGNVGIGTFTPDHTLTVMGTADKTGGGSWEVFSDERLKNIKGRFTPGLKAVMQLQPLRYEYKPDNALGIKSSGEHIGFGAQAVQKIIPEAVSLNEKGYLLVNNDPIMWTMLNAIKEQEQQITRQRAAAKQQQDQIAALRTANTALNARLRLIEQSLKSKRGSTRRRR